MLSGSSDARRWWRHKVASFDKPFFASAVSELRPQLVENVIADRHLSVVLDRGVRHYCFEGQAARDRFLTHYRKVYSAQPCPNPCP
jgi:hypothetical protein